MRLLFLVSDAYGGHGGIARFNQDFCAALSAAPGVAAVTVLPRRAPLPPEAPPPRVRQLAVPPGGHREQGFATKAAYGLAAARLAAVERFDAVICGHINLTPVAALARRLTAMRRGREHGRPVPLALVLHGVDAWTPVRVPGLGGVDVAVAVSRHTLDRFRAWSGLAEARGLVLPNMVDPAAFTPGPPPPALVARYGLAGRRVVMGLARLDVLDRDKGFYEMLAILPRLAATHPDLCYLLCGDGNDRPHLEARARALGVAERVVFTGRVAEAEKADHYRLADAFVLCGRQEGFGIVLLEAMACGVPVVASTRDGSREAVADGAFGLLADPDDPAGLAAAVEHALALPRPHRPAGLEAAFGPAAYAARVHGLLARLGKASRLGEA